VRVVLKIPFEDPLVLNYVRAGCDLVQVIVLAVYYYVSPVMKRKNDQTLLKYVHQHLSQGPENLVKTTVRDYNLSEPSKLFRSVYLGIEMMAFVHLYFNFTQPLFIQARMVIYDAKPVSIHLLKDPAVGELMRPFKVANLFEPSTRPLTDAAAIAEAEKRASKKEE
ncbi:hypothetical protein K443DRAFT_97442, partial [Laccaria amethystina LaAM-08-1]